MLLSTTLLYELQRPVLQCWWNAWRRYGITKPGCATFSLTEHSLTESFSAGALVFWKWDHTPPAYSHTIILLSLLFPNTECVSFSKGTIATCPQLQCKWSISKMLNTYLEVIGVRLLKFIVYSYFTSSNPLKPACPSVTNTLLLLLAAIGGYYTLHLQAIL